MLQAQGLPIDDVLPAVQETLRERDELVLMAPPGAGKTTVVPLALLSEPWLGDQKILMLEPRRIAARAAAHRMATLLGQVPGETVGYRMRLETRVSRQTRIEVVTEGVFTRMLADDPSLEGVGLVIFDEFHERSLDADLALTLCLHGRRLFRDTQPLKLLVMSATLDMVRVADLLQAPSVVSEGRLFPVSITYTGASVPGDRIAARTAETVRRALAENPHSSILVFLPGQGEIGSVAGALTGLPVDVSVHPLYGNLSLEAQQAAIAPAAPGRRKVVLATNIAETSLTIDGVDVVVDSGLVREPVFDPVSAMTRLQTRRISRASSVQRAGRAGRLKPGCCYRLWASGQQDQLAPQGEPEILNADLAPLALQLYAFGVANPAELAWLDAPPAGAWQQAVELLGFLGAIRDQGLTPHGEALASLPLHPRLGHLLIAGAWADQLPLAADLAAILSERDPLGQDNPDMAARLDLLQGGTDHRGWVRRTRQLAAGYVADISRIALSAGEQVPGISLGDATGYLLACAYPDRIARKRHGGGYQLANGRSANLPDIGSLSKQRWLAVAEVGGIARRKGDIIRSAAPLNPALFEGALSHLAVARDRVEWDRKADRFVAERRVQVGSLLLSRQTLPDVPADARRRALLDELRNRGLDALPWTLSLRQWQARVLLLRKLEPGAWPDVSDEHLFAALEDWLGPYLEPVRRFADLRRIDLEGALRAMLDWSAQQQLDELAPERYRLPSGSTCQLDYLKDPPVLAVKLQEMFGVESSPRIAGGRIALLVHLLSPAGRPLQVTQDLAAFWRNAYGEVKKEMRGRYPKHPWPDDPLAATPTGRTKPK
ncbi:MAG: ATP-dependent helicase HrpB [Pseudomonadota bacterium]